ncbi:hypothetical protein LRR81_19950 [Metabacillus sp. GX 13764]|uniref:immunoglobulin-like domain-containing protein n=1 Tax=Metabacillus kandeliae TaxID=2900151 RepID=UPI001E2C8122|nr:immunoglobulin-like domain-containing protein [Metabacillus kandeliae]MCD7036525.1 hypothetical protein [Metabacillus kandeliae]
MKKALFSLLILVLFLSGCGASAGSIISYKKSSYGNVPSEIGDTSRVKGINLQAFDTKLQKTEYIPATGKWLSFSGKGKGKIGGSITNGYQLPGSEVAFTLNSRPKGMNIRFQLTERDINLKRISLIKEQVSGKLSFKAILPRKENAFYLLSCEILSKAGKAEDAALFSVYAITPEINAKFSPSKKVYQTNEAVKLTYVSFGPLPLMTGAGYIVEKYRHNRWEEIIYPHQAASAVGILITPEHPFNIDAGPLERGKYRVIKSVDVSGFDLKQNLAAYFEVK